MRIVAKTLVALTVGAVTAAVLAAPASAGGWQPPPSASVSASVTATATATPSATVTPTATATATASPSATAPAPSPSLTPTGQLPVTGRSIPLLILGGGGLLIFGLALAFMVRGRRPRSFRA